MLPVGTQPPFHEPSVQHLCGRMPAAQFEDVLAGRFQRGEPVEWCPPDQRDRACSMSRSVESPASQSRKSVRPWRDSIQSSVVSAV